MARRCSTTSATSGPGVTVPSETVRDPTLLRHAGALRAGPRRRRRPTWSSASSAAGPCSTAPPSDLEGELRRARPSRRFEAEEVPALADALLGGVANPASVASPRLIPWAAGLRAQGSAYLGWDVDRSLLHGAQARAANGGTGGGRGRVVRRSPRCGGRGRRDEGRDERRRSSRSLPPGTPASTRSGQGQWFAALRMASRPRPASSTAGARRTGRDRADGADGTQPRLRHRRDPGGDRGLAGGGKRARPSSSPTPMTGRDGCTSASASIPSGSRTASCARGPRLGPVDLALDQGHGADHRVEERLDLLQQSAVLLLPGGGDRVVAAGTAVGELPLAFDQAVATPSRAAGGTSCSG